MAARLEIGDRRLMSFNKLCTLIKVRIPPVLPYEADGGQSYVYAERQTQSVAQDAMDSHV